MRWSCFGAALLLSVLAATPAAADAIDDIPPGSWYEVPSSHMADVIPMPALPNNGGVGSIMGAWSGGAYDTARERLLVWGGGHSDYSGNEIYAFDVNALSWSVVWGPTPEAQIPSGMEFETYLDGNPSSRHTYSGLAYAPPPIDSMYALGGSRWQNGYGTNAVWRFDFGSDSWSQQTGYPGGVNFGDATDFDPVTGHLFHRGLTVFGEYDPAGDGWQNRYEDSGGWYTANMTGAIDPERRLMVIAGSGELVSFSLDSYSYDTPTSNGGDAIINTSAPGFTYDSKEKLFVAWAGGSDVYTLNPDTWEWLVHSSAGTAPGAPQMNGTFGRFRYAPSRNVFVLANDVDQNVFVYRLSPGSGVPPPDPGTGGSGGASAGSGGASGTASGSGGGLAAAANDDESGCACDAAGRDGNGQPVWLLALWIGVWARRRQMNGDSPNSSGTVS